MLVSLVQVSIARPKPLVGDCYYWLKVCNIYGEVRLAKIDLVTIFDFDYGWYCTVDYLIANYIGIHHLFYHIQ